MAVRQFDGVDDVITLSIGTLAAMPQGAATFAFIVNRTDTDGFRTPIDLGSGTTQRRGIQGSGSSIYYIQGASFPSLNISWANGWVLVAATKAAGNNAPRAHKYVYSTQVWTHTNWGSNLGNGSAADTVRIGELSGIGEFFQGRIAVIGCWKRVLTDTELEGLTATFQSWSDLTPDALWKLNQDSVSTAVEDTTGNGANQTAITGTSVVTTDDPPGFDFGGGGTTVTPTGIASAEAFGTATVTATLTVSPTGVATGEAFGTPTVTATLTASPTGIASAEAVGSPTVTASLTVTPTGIATAEAFGTVAVQTTGSVVPVGIASAEAFGTATITATLTSSPTGIASAGVVGTPTVMATLTVSPVSIASAEAIGVPAVTATLTVQPTGIASAESFGTLVVQTGAFRDITVIAQLRSDHVTGGVTLSDLVAGLRSDHIQGGVDVRRNMITGSVEYVTAEVTFVGETAASIATATGQIAITSDDTIPGTFVAVDVTERTDVNGGALLALSKLHTAGAAGEYRVWAKVTDNPEIPILKCGFFSVR